MSTEITVVRIRDGATQTVADWGHARSTRYGLLAAMALGVAFWGAVGWLVVWMVRG